VSNIAVLLTFSGLIAFIPDSPSSNRITAYMIGNNDHRQRLVLSMRDLQDPLHGCPADFCQTDGRDCVCGLRNTEIILDTQESDKIIQCRESARAFKKRGCGERRSYSCVRLDGRLPAC
jgi:hypothetical protein